MLIEVIQMSMALGLFAIGVWLYSLTKPARPRKLVRVTTPIWASWASSLLIFVTNFSGKRRTTVQLID